MACRSRHVSHSLAERVAALKLFPGYLKADYSTAGQGVWHVTNFAEQDRAAQALETQGLLDGTHEVVVQEEAPGVLCQAQAVFAQGHLLALHCTQTRGVSVGGGHAARMGVDHPQVREHLVTLGQALGWHGPLALDYLFDETSGQLSYIEANPRLVEPMNAVLSGVNLADLTVQVALGVAGSTDKIARGAAGKRSHSLMALLLGSADHGGSRRDLLRAIAQAMAGRGIFAESTEDLTPFCTDPLSTIPFAVVAWRCRCARARRIASPPAPSMPIVYTRPLSRPFSPSICQKGVNDERRTDTP